jgi:Ca2+-binding RTX toxin-like protein
MSISIDQWQLAGEFNYGVDASFTRAVRDLYPVDLNQDDIDEVIFAGFESQCCVKSAAEYTNTKISIFGWEDGIFKDITHKWLKKGDEIVEGIGDIAFGDFNNDKKVDIYMAGNADMEYRLSSFEFLNLGSHLQKKNLGLTMYEHGAASGDINGDGFDDVIVAAYTHPSPYYLGGPDGLKRYYVKSSNDYNSYETFGSGVTIGNFAGSKNPTIIVSDSAPGQNSSDTRQSNLFINTQEEYGFKFIRELPTPRLLLPKYEYLVSGTLKTEDKSHDVRVKTFNFSGDEFDDVIVFSRAGNNGNIWPSVSQLQFLKNQADGSFVDVTENLLIGYPVNSDASYAPVFIDANLDGLIDIFISVNNNNTPDSTSLLLQSADGRFVDVGRQVLSANVFPGGTATVARGPDHQMFLVTELQEYLGGATVKIAKLSFPERNLDELLVGSQQSDRIFGLAGNDVIQAFAGDDTVFGGDGNDSLSGGVGNDALDGGDGTDAVTFKGQSSDFRVEKVGGNWLVRDTRTDANLNQGEDTLTGVERVGFEDKVLALDTDGVAGKAYRVYKAAFNRDPMQGDTSGLGFWIDKMDNAMDLIEVSARFVDSNEFRTLYGTNPTNAQFLNKLYENVLGRQPEATGYNWWLNELNTNPSKTKAKVLADFAESGENQAGVASLIGNGITYEPWVG